MSMRIFKFPVILFLWIACAGCEKKEMNVSPDELIYGRGDTATVYFDYMLVSGTPAEVAPVLQTSRAGDAGTDKAPVEDINLYVFNERGDLVSFRYDTALQPLELTIYSKMQYTVYAIANAGRELPVRTETEMGKMMYDAPENGLAENASGSVLMSGKTSPQILYDGCTLPVNLTRCVAKITVRGDFTDLYPDVKLTVKRIGLKNVPKTVAVFRQSKVLSPEQACDGPAVENIALEKFVSGIPFYVFENRQGTLLPDNLEQMQKTFPPESPFYGVCTYVEIAAAYESPRKKGEILYRFYPGTDMVSNFDVIRNMQQDITVFFKRDGAVEENTWRVDNSRIRDLVTSITLDPSFCKFTSLGDSRKIEVEILPPTADNRELVWSSSDSSVARVSPDGIVMSVGNGSCTITARTTDGTDISADCRVEVDSKVYVTDIKVVPAELSLFEGETGQLEAVVEPAGASEPGVQWSASEPGTASVDRNGKVTAIAAGECIVTATSVDDETKEAVCRVMVHAKELTVEPLSKTLYEGEKFVLKYSARPQAPAVFTSSDTSVAVVSDKGEITALKAGKADIKVSANGKEAICRVTVEVPKISFPTAGHIMYEGETVMVPYSVLVPSDVIPQVMASNEKAEVTEITSAGITVRAKSPGSCRITAQVGRVQATYDLDIRELKIVFEEEILEVYQNFRKEISYTVYPEHARVLAVDFSVSDAADMKYIRILPESGRVEGTEVSDSEHPLHSITATFRDFPSKEFVVFCKVKANRVLKDTLKLVANRALSRYYNDPLSLSEDAFVLDTDPNAKPVWTIDRRDGIIFDENGRAALKENKTEANGLYNVTLSIQGENGTMMVWDALKLIVYEELNVYSLLVQQQTGMSGDEWVYDEWRESTVSPNPLSPFWKKVGWVFPDRIVIPPWGEIINGETLVVSDVSVAYYPVDASGIYSPASIELLDWNRWTENVGHGYYYYITSYPLYQATEAYWRIFYPEG